MTHPDPECNRYQKEFLENCSPEKRAVHELIFKVGNATVRYHQLAKNYQPGENEWKEWIEGLQEPIKSHMFQKGFVGCKNILSFTRYIMEKNDQGLDEYLKTNLDANDLAAYNKIVSAEESNKT